MPTALPCPLSVAQAVDRYFIPCRFQALEIAAFIDRLARCADAAQAAPEDFRVAALKRAAQVIADDAPDKAKRIQELFSDPSMEPLLAAHTKGACGAVEPKGAVK